MLADLLCHSLVQAGESREGVADGLHLAPQQMGEAAVAWCFSSQWRKWGRMGRMWGL